MIRTLSRMTRLLLACPDRPGLIAAVSGFLAEAGRNIVDADQHSSAEGRLFMRMVFESAPEGDREELRELRGGGCKAALRWTTASLRRASESASG